jgi:CRP-like cAMP-binding protein
VSPQQIRVEAHYSKSEALAMLDSLPTTKQDFSEVAVDGSLYECKASPDLIAAFEKRAIKVICSENQVLFSNGEPGRCVYLVLAGEVGLLLPLTSMDGMGFRAQSGSFVGLPAAFSNEPYSMTAVARKGAEFAMMSRDRFCDLIATSPTLSLDVLRILAAETRAARIAIVEAGIGRRRSRTQR